MARPPPAAKPARGSATTARIQAAFDFAGARDSEYRDERPEVQRRTRPSSGAAAWRSLRPHSGGPPPAQGAKSIAGPPEKRSIRRWVNSRPVPDLGDRANCSSYSRAYSPPRFQQLLVCALLAQFAVMQDQDRVGVLYGGQPVRDHQRRASAHKYRDGLLDTLLERRVDRAGGFIEHEDQRIERKRAGKGKELPFAHGQRCASLAQRRRGTARAAAR